MAGEFLQVNVPKLPLILAFFKRKIHAAEKIIATLQEQVDVLVVEAREKQDTEKELTCERNAMMSNSGISEKEWAALTAVLADLDINIKISSNTEKTLEDTLLGY